MSDYRETPEQNGSPPQGFQTGTPSVAFSLIGGVLTVLLGAAFWWAWLATPPQLGRVHLLTIFATSCLIGPISMVSLVLATKALSADERRLAPSLAIVLCCAGIAVLLRAWSLQS
jgi:hypothetical protein